MKDITCPKCGTVFQVDESHYAEILSQVRTKEFDNELSRREKELQKQFEIQKESLRLSTEKEFEQQLARKEIEIGELTTKITRLDGVIAGSEANLKSKLSELETRKQEEFYKAIEKKKDEITELEKQLRNKDSEHKLALLEERNRGNEVLQNKENEIVRLKLELDSNRLAAENRESQLREQYKMQLDDKQAEIERLKDFKMRLSTKMVGETLEQHCANLFANAQSLGLYPDALFIKDNTVMDHSKGDFIFRDYIDETEYVSVMFEMKNEMDTTATKHRNDDFLDKLDKDRRKKGCEYAVLVSMLEQDSELYNSGIVDKSYRYPKMLVIRPQFFLPVLRLITEGSRKGFAERESLRRELEAARSHSLDFAKFEDKINRFRTSFNNNVMAAHKKFTAATEGIDKTIEALEKQIKALRDIKANFEASEQKLLKANEIADENLTVKKLTHGNPNIRRLIEEAADE
ncbi:MAG: DUF2130 domain-containing protein [Muribaculaceae bacterium]|nr:DUF2130 domain-containing protein [Muribaculaceae bacterium]